ncbi:MAG TPA: MFS transporter [Ktedonobacterales bacterium]
MAIIQVDAPRTGASLPGKPHLSRRELLGLSLPWFALNFQFAALLPVVIPAQILLFVAPGSAGNAQQALFLGAMAALGAVTALILQPTIGALSDRTRTRFGRRRPFMLAGAGGLLVGLALLALSHVLALFIGGLFIVLIANTVSSTASQGLVPDCVPVHQRGTASGFVGLMTLLGTVGSLAVASVLLGQSTSGGAATSGIAHGAALFYIVAAAVLALFATIPLLLIKENTWARRIGLHGALHPSEHADEQTNEAGAATGASGSRWAALLHPWRQANFRWVFLTRAFVMLGLALFMTYIEYYFARVAHVTNFVQATAVIAILSLAGAVASTLLVGIISDRIGRRAPIVAVASTFMAAAALIFVVAPGQVPLWPLGLLFGLGYGAYMSVDVALAVDTLPSRHAAGRDLGIWSMASTLPAVIAPVLGSAVIVLASNIGQMAFGYRGVFALATVFLVLGAALVLKVRENRTHHSDSKQDSDSKQETTDTDSLDMEQIAV